MEVEEEASEVGERESANHCFLFASLSHPHQKAKKIMGDPGEDRTHGLQIATFCGTRARRSGGGRERERREREKKTKKKERSLSLSSLSHHPQLPPPRLLLLFRSLMLYPTELRGPKTKRFRAP